MISIKFLIFLPSYSQKRAEFERRGSFFMEGFIVSPFKDDGDNLYLPLMDPDQRLRLIFFAERISLMKTVYELIDPSEARRALMIKHNRNVMMYKSS